jgi:hypothetical protein
MQNDLVCVVTDRIRNTPGVTKIRIAFKLEHQSICTWKILCKKE